ncbi:unnamed protein product, partial [Larinioides sclopetarius]
FFPNEKWCFLCCSVRVPFCNPSPRESCYVIKIQAFDYGKRSCWRLGTSS